MLRGVWGCGVMIVWSQRCSNTANWSRRRCWQNRHRWANSTFWFSVGECQVVFLLICCDLIVFEIVCCDRSLFTMNSVVTKKSRPCWLSVALLLTPSIAEVKRRSTRPHRWVLSYSLTFIKLGLLYLLLALFCSNLWFHLLSCYFFFFLNPVTGVMRNCQNGCKDVVAMLIECGADVDRANNASWTPLYVAAEVSNWYLDSYLCFFS